ncbi:MAG TPA: glycoside hydrolase family 31 protein [Ohtaekwangia sp.]|uniref:glycoside hydrolase family 31 protein n=1 Tax=Ohtaekwangia sp. TaxID=2066019 RepID=UPI002F93EDF1
MSRTINSPLSKSLGSLTHWKNIKHALVGETSHGRFQIQFYNEGITRISVTQADTFEDFSYSVVASPSYQPTVTEHTDALEVVTSKFKMRITKNPVRFSFYTLDNQPINEDDQGFGTSWNGEQITTYKKMQAGERFIGLGEKTGPLDRKGNGYQNWNTDNFAYSPGSDPLYCSIPFYIGVHNGLSYGIFFDNSHKSFFNFGASNNRFTSFAADSGEMNYYFIHGNSVGEIIQQYTHLTGRMEMPPLWSIGYQQCRYSYYPDKEVLTLARTFREKDIPADTIVFDIHYMDQYKIFTWSQRDFSDPKELLVQLQRMGFHVVVMCDPGIKVEEGYDTYDKGIREDVFIKYQDGTNYTGQVWPGWCHFPDFTNPKTRLWWQKQFHDYVNIGVEGFWNDMNEIATWGQMIPENIELDFEGNKASMRRGRNIYGMQMARSTYEGAKALLKGKRPFNLTRSGFSGVQRYAAVWTGDNVAYDEHMLLGVRLVNSMGLSGIAFAGYDVGGFVGDANSKLFARWVSIGAFSPFFRGHSMINSRDSEPWAYGEEVEQISRNYIKFRYQLLPYIYSLFYDASTTGIPVQRSLAIDYTHDWKIYDGQFHNQFLLGPSILVAPAESNKEFVKVYFPEGDWYSLYNGQKYAGQSEVIVECPVHRLPVFVKGGAILPMKPVQSSTKEVSDHLILHVYAGKQNTSFIHYEDDGSTFQYQEGRFAKRLLEYRPHERMFIINATEGTYVSPVRKLKVVLHGFDGTLAQALVNGNPVAVINDVNQFFAALEKFDPFFDPEPAPQENVHSLEIEYSTGPITIQW